MKALLVLLFTASFAFADLGTKIYVASGTASTQSADVYVHFSLIGFTGTIGGAAFSNVTVNIPVVSGFQGGVGQRLNAIPYIVTSGTLVITEVK